ncbi:MAG: FliM/FliN family flagellar motor switch protein [Acidiphilium sp.]|jgi:flagellar motor switch protein FliN/FliY|uniref:FliM/FliN family flagellar motor switch protein n=1 Tax=Acidiphilium acidophilum TaxID=76588 RepID=UPI002A0E6DA3|nr:FliM/FliN family flagellar motor switch protein [Acidiphilium sp.]MEE3501336.1 FliM/FliN family flagellar motor switch protein [Acidiphilium acidophilum]
MTDKPEQPPTGSKREGPQVIAEKINRAPPQDNKTAINVAIMDGVSVTFSVEVGRISIPFRSVRTLKQGEVIALDRPINDPMDIRVNGTLVGRGQVVSTEAKKFGIRITEIIAPTNETH